MRLYVGLSNDEKIDLIKTSTHICQSCAPPLSKLIYFTEKFKPIIIYNTSIGDLMAQDEVYAVVEAALGGSRQSRVRCFQYNLYA